VIAVLDFGMGNIHSLLKAISLFTQDFRFTKDKEDINRASKIILPGDGHFHKAMENLNELRFVEEFPKWIQNGKAVFGICIGYQVLFEDSDEAVGKNRTIPGLALVHGKIRKFEGKPHTKVPHMGWNKLHHIHSKSLLLSGVPKESYMYFIHSYRPTGVDPAIATAECNYYGEYFPAVIENKRIFGTQFHPEKSDKQGLQILKNFIEANFD